MNKERVIIIGEDALHKLSRLSVNSEEISQQMNKRGFKWPFSPSDSPAVDYHDIWVPKNFIDISEFLNEDVPPSALIVQEKIPETIEP